MKNPYQISMDQARKQWQTSSMLLASQIHDLDQLLKKIKAPWMAEQLQQHINFLIDLNNLTDDFVQQSTHLVKLQQLHIYSLNELVQTYATRDPELFKELVNKLRS